MVQVKSMFRPFEAEYELGDTLGTGGYAVVRVGVHRQTGVKYAVKIMKVGSCMPALSPPHRTLLRQCVGKFRARIDGVLLCTHLVKQPDPSHVSRNGSGALETLAWVRVRVGVGVRALTPTLALTLP